MNVSGIRKLIQVAGWRLYGEAGKGLDIMKNTNM